MDRRGFVQGSAALAGLSSLPLPALAQSLSDLLERAAPEDDAGARLAVLVLTVAAVLVLELLNTAIEAVVDLAIGRQFHPLARIAKDCAAAAVLVASLSSLMIALLLLLPPLAARLSH
jgi:hypothetical protein